MQTIRSVASLATALLITACGGGSSTPVAPIPDASVPATVGDSVSALTDFARQQRLTDTDEPLQLGTVIPAIDDTAEPARL